MSDTISMSTADKLLWNVISSEELFCIWGIATLKAPLLDDTMEKAVKHLLQQIPILNSRPEFNIFRGHWKQISYSEINTILTRKKYSTAVKADNALKNIYCNPINPAREPMIRFTSIDSPSTYYFVIQVHHMAVDGEGLKRICTEFAHIYKSIHSDPEWKPGKKPHPGRSWQQISGTFSIRHFIWIFEASAIIGFELLRSAVLKRNRYNIAGDSHSFDRTSSKPSHPYFEKIKIEKNEMLRFRLSAKKNQVTINDMLMTSLSLAIYQWNRKRIPGEKRNWLKFGYTANLRRWWGEPEGTFGNFSSVLMFEQSIEKINDPKALLDTVKTRMDHTKKRISLDLFMILAILKLLPNRAVSRLSIVFKKALVNFLRYNHAITNMGILGNKTGDFGHTEAVDYSLLAPTGPGGCIIYSVSTYKNRITLSLGGNEDYLKKESAAAFLRLWREKTALLSRV